MPPSRKPPPLIKALDEYLDSVRLFNNHRSQHPPDDLAIYGNAYIQVCKTYYIKQQSACTNTEISIHTAAAVKVQKLCNCRVSCIKLNVSLKSSQGWALLCLMLQQGFCLIQVEYGRLNGVCLHMGMQIE